MAISEVMRHILHNSAGRLLVNGVLPRGSHTGGTPHGRDWANDIPELNRLLEESVSRLREKWGKCRLAYAGCTQNAFLQHPARSALSLPASSIALVASDRQLCRPDVDGPACEHTGINVSTMPDGLPPG